MNEEFLLYIEQAADVFITSERREPRRFGKTVFAMSMAIPSLRLKDDPEKYQKIPNLEALLRFKSTLTDLHHRVTQGTTQPSRRLCEVIMAMGYDHLANYFLGYLNQEIFQQLPKTTTNVFTSIRRKVGAYVKEARDKLQVQLSSGAYKVAFCRDCSSQAFLHPKVVAREHLKIPDIRGECLLCGCQGRVRMCSTCANGFFLTSAEEAHEKVVPGGVEPPRLTLCPTCRCAPDGNG